MFLSFLRNSKDDDLSIYRKKQLKELCKVLKIKIKALSLLDRALTHTSAVDNKNEKCIKSYERLEYLGDSILNSCIAYILYKKSPYMKEGLLSAIRSSVVDEKTLYEISMKFNLLKYIRLGGGEILSDTRAKEKVSADVFEALIAVIFLENGFNKTLKFIENIMLDIINSRLDNGTRDYKSKLQKLVVSKYKEYPIYSIVNEEGPDHNKVYEVMVNVHNEYFAKAKGRSKKEAEQYAAKIILEEYFNNIDEKI